MVAVTIAEVVWRNYLQNPIKYIHILDSLNILTLDSSNNTALWVLKGFRSAQED